ncbi:helix-turn-helix domain-containing protein [Pedobacter nutrimenti]|uniref:Helix-turn-helix protein n=1 Tax=Pedobacter nutrimenti TaxID=1241337 RepID=A0A318UED2_9SPHI|nr:AraC family transcriptional regulator [Pedobacter nutrimenti]PYF74746.1 helix-turn-helix protein [Pedobacter nutrimenti]
MSISLTTGKYFGTEEKKVESPLFRINMTNYQSYSTIEQHYHQNSYLSMLVRGTYLENSSDMNRRIAPGEVILRPSGYNHANSFPAPGGSCMNIEFHQDALKSLDIAAYIPEKTKVYPAGAFTDLYKLLYLFINDGDACNAQEHVINWISSMKPPVVALRLPWLAKLRQILEDELETQHSLEQLSGRVFVHPVYLARAFREKEGLTIGEYRLKMRLKKSVRLLFETDLPISEIAYTTGFTDPAHFIKSFRLYYPVSPFRFRSLTRGK